MPLIFIFSESVLDYLHAIEKGLPRKQKSIVPKSKPIIDIVTNPEFKNPSSLMEVQKIKEDNPPEGKFLIILSLIILIYLQNENHSNLGQNYSLTFPACF